MSFLLEVLRLKFYSSTLFTEHMISLHTRQLPITILNFKAHIYKKKTFICVQLQGKTSFFR